MRGPDAATPTFLPSFSASSLITACLVVLCACGAASPPVAATPPSAAARAAKAKGGKPQHAELREQTGNVLPQECEPNAQESCNALDDDCNGVIDDGCGYETGGVQITAAWDSGADIDLYVTDPSGDTLYYNEQHDRTRGGGYLDQNARGDCRRNQKNPRVENAYWPSPAPEGPYKVELHYFGPCETSGATRVQLSVAVSGKLLGSYQYTLKPEQRIQALAFDLE
jgi:hypothetical protein